MGESVLIGRGNSRTQRTAGGVKHGSAHQSSSGIEKGRASGYIAHVSLRAHENRVMDTLAMRTRRWTGWLGIVGWWCEERRPLSELHNACDINTLRWHLCHCFSGSCVGARCIASDASVSGHSFFLCPPIFFCPPGFPVAKPRGFLCLLFIPLLLWPSRRGFSLLHIFFVARSPLPAVAQPHPRRRLRRNSGH